MNKDFPMKKMLLIFFLFTACTLSAESSLIKVGVCSFEYDNGEDSVLANGISSAFFETVSGIGERRIGSDEISELISIDKKSEILKKRLSIEDLYEERDKLLFNTDMNELAETLKEKEDEISAAKKELKKLVEEEASLSENIDKDAYSDVELQINSPDDGPLYTREAGAIAETAEKNDLDLIVYGFVERIDEYRFVEVRIWNQILKKDLTVWKTAVGSEDISNLVAPGLKQIKTEIIGKDWSEISIRGPENSLIYLNGKFCGIGKLNRITMDPGDVEIVIKKNGYKSVSKKVLIERYESNEYTFDLEKLEYRSVVIQTFPASADIYVDSVWSGQSPLKIEPDSETVSITVKKEGYDEQKFFINENTENIINLYLKPLSEGRKEYVSGKRKRFYSSMGGFILSLPATLIIYNMVEQSASAYNREIEKNDTDNLDELIRIENLNSAQYSLYLASIGMNIFLFLDTMLQAADYVSSVEYFSN